MNEFTIDYLLQLLDRHYIYYFQYKTLNDPRANTQNAFYLGLFIMLENVVSDRYTNGVTLVRDEYGKHYIKK